MIVVMTGLPGTGKSTIAAALAAELPALILNKDTLRAALFPPDEIEYSSSQNDFVLGIMLQIADFYVQKDPMRNIILDGRPFSKRDQVDTLLNFSEKHKWDLWIINCTCSNEVAKERLERDAASNGHLAANRDFSLYERLQAQSDPLQFPHLSLDTEESLELCISSCLNYLNNHSIK